MSQWVAEKVSVKAPLPLVQPLKVPWAVKVRVVPLRAPFPLEKVNTAAEQLEMLEVAGQTRLPDQLAELPEPDAVTVPLPSGQR
jgi:hypothetical protein